MPRRLIYFATQQPLFIRLLLVLFIASGITIPLLFRGIHLSVSAAIGFTALFGQAVLSGVVMVSYYDEMRKEGRHALDAVGEGSQARLQTVLMTVLPTLNLMATRNLQVEVPEA